LAQSLSADEFADVEVQLSKDFAWLLPRDPAVEARRWRAAGLIADPADRDLRPRRRLSRPPDYQEAPVQDHATPCSQSQIGPLSHLRLQETAQVEIAVALSVIVRSGPARTAVNGTVVARRQDDVARSLAVVATG